jgi:hypothetical protein
VPASASSTHGSQRFLTCSVLPTRYEAYHLDMRRHPVWSDSESSDRSLPADMVLREEPEDEEEEDEEEDERKEDDDDDDDDEGDDGYSE